ncbi:MAG: glutamine--fructose-6-phosphate transaminase (isomerizing) [Armatimonadota bacterium]
MCGIAGYVGPREAVSIVIDQLRRLEYRGYDSAGVAWRSGNGIAILKKEGRLDSLVGEVVSKKPTAHIAIAHSRWATHGKPSDENAHPHTDSTGRIAVIHNGIIENYIELFHEMTQEGELSLSSETDTEIAAHLIGREYQNSGDFVEAVRSAVRKLRGAFAMVILCENEPDKIVAVRNASPLVLGIGKNENFLASDIPALLPYTRDVIVMDEGDLAVITSERIHLEDAMGRPKLPHVTHVDWDIEAAEKGGHEHFMLKETLEQPDALRACLAGRLMKDGTVTLGDTLPAKTWTDFQRILIVACGTAYNAGLLGEFLLEAILRVPVEVYYASEFRYNNPILRPSDLVIVISQSGETADTLAALRLVKEAGVPTLGIVNVVGSSIARECDSVLYTQAGPEICVASTKAYSAQVATLSLIALYASHLRGGDREKTSRLQAALAAMPETLAEVIRRHDTILPIAEEIHTAPLMFFLGRGADAAVALEGALKMKEIAYIPTQESPAGEMKHGPLALVQPGVVAVFGITNPVTRDKALSNVKEVAARGGTTVGIILDSDTLSAEVLDRAIRIPHIDSPTIAAAVSALPLQLLAYHVARLRGCDIDKPRNLAKSVTVE